MKPSSRPSWGWYVLAVLVSLVGACGTSCAVHGRLAAQVENLPRVASPAELHVVLASGWTTIYAESRSEIDGEDVSTDDDSQLHCRLTGPDGRDVDLVPSVSEVSYDYGAYAGRSVFDADLPRPGEYALSCAAPDDAPAVAAISSGLLTSMKVARLAVWSALGFGVLIGIIVFLLRSERRVRRTPPAPPAPPASPAPPPAAT